MNRLRNGRSTVGDGRSDTPRIAPNLWRPFTNRITRQAQHEYTSGGLPRPLHAILRGSLHKGGGSMNGLVRCVAWGKCLDRCYHGDEYHEHGRSCEAPASRCRKLRGVCRPKRVVPRKTTRNKPSAKIAHVCFTCANIECLKKRGCLCKPHAYDYWQPRATSHVG